MLNTINSPVRRIKGKVELFNSSAFLGEYSYTDRLKTINIDRVGEQNKFFGFGICQRLNFHLVDKDREINYLTTDNSFKVYFSAGADYVSNFPTFYETEKHRDEKTNELSITAYDAIYRLSEHFWNEINITAPYTLNDVVEAICAFMGCSWGSNVNDDSFSLYYEAGANLEGTETIREVLNAIAEATQTIYYLDNNDNLYFKRLERDAEAIYTITKDEYFDLHSGDGKRLGIIASITELGENISSSITATGSTQYVRNNPFWELREDIAELTESAINKIGGLTIDIFNCFWRGNYLLNIGDKIDIITKDNNKLTSYLLDEAITYNGGFESRLKWEYKDEENEHTNSATLGEVLKYTYAKVDKVNKQIDIVATDVQELAQLQLTTENIIATVSNDIDDLTQRAETAISAEDVKIQIQQELTNGVDKVITATGFIFDSNGLQVSKTGSEMTTEITEDGMRVNRGNTEVLTADNTGVKAENLHATTYLIVGDNSRFEDFGGRTGCFYIG